MANPISLPWQTDALKHPVFKPFNDVLALNHHPQFPSIDQLNDRLNHCKQALERSDFKKSHAWTDQEKSIDQHLKFIDQQQIDQDLYYEQQIFLKRQIPTRLNHYHDFLGAWIWMLFPRTKMLFNHWHQEQIDRYGLKNRSRLRDLITLFDESGLILLYRETSLITPLFDYDWKTFFLSQKEQWHKHLIPICFGHGLLEQWLAPHPNITAKALPILISSDQWPNLQNLSNQQNQWQISDFFKLDQLIYEHFQQDLLKFAEIFDRNEKLPYRTFSPLPMIGIPSYAENQDENFYENPKCFKNRKRFITETEIIQTHRPMLPET